MPEALPVVLPVAFVALVVVIALLALHYEKKRRERLAAFAAANGFEYFPGGDPSGAEPSGCSFSFFGSAYGNWFERFEGFSPFGHGHSQRASNLLLKRDGDLTWYFFDYQYTTGSGKNQSTHRFWISVVETRANFPGLRIRGQSFFDRIGAFVGFRDIEFESSEFNDRFHVSAVDERFAYAMVHPGMMEFLMSGSDVDWQLNGNLLLVANSGSLDTSQIGQAMAGIRQFLGHVPEFVWRDFGFVKPY